MRPRVSQRDLVVQESLPSQQKMMQFHAVVRFVDLQVRTACNHYPADACGVEAVRTTTCDRSSSLHAGMSRATVICAPHVCILQSRRVPCPLLQVKQVYSHAHIWAYGSLASNLQLPDSDVDLCLAFDGVQACCPFCRCVCAFLGICRQCTTCCSRAHGSIGTIRATHLRL